MYMRSVPRSFYVASDSMNHQAKNFGNHWQSFRRHTSFFNLGKWDDIHTYFYKHSLQFAKNLLCISNVASNANTCNCCSRGTAPLNTVRTRWFVKAAATTDHAAGIRICMRMLVRACVACEGCSASVGRRCCCDAFQALLQYPFRQLPRCNTSVLV